MPVPEVGQTAPDFTLKQYDRGTQHHLAEITKRSPSLITFFKKSCATCRLTLPFVERLHRHYPGLEVVGISQDDSDDTTEFVKQAGLTFTVVRDGDWKVSTAYDLFTVPSAFLLDRGGTIKRVNMGWSKDQYTGLSDEIALALGTTPIPLLKDSDKAPVFKPG